MNLKEEELLAQLRRQQEEFKMKTQEQLQREKELQEAHAKEIHKKEQMMNAHIDQALKELGEQKEAQAANERKLLEK